MNFTIEPVDPHKELKRKPKKIGLSTSVEPDVYSTVQLFALDYEITVSEYLRSLILADIESKFDMDEELKRGLLEGFRESRGYEVAHEVGQWLSIDRSGNNVKDGEVC
ncbi:unnamed protein product [marine sediment metagenome]|uniref:Uncharacterized protein n=1 Tax=marine sediment metagenome TaxID=412755 RepID=X0UU32_9ZZZZ